MRDGTAESLRLTESGDPGGSHLGKDYCTLIALPLHTIEGFLSKDQSERPGSR
jgi:hypothetical protein